MEFITKMPVQIRAICSLVKCGVCGAKFTSEVCATNHYGSSRHRKREAYSKEGGAGGSSVQSGVEVLKLRPQVEVLQGAAEVHKSKTEETRREVEVLQVKVEELQCKVEELKTCTSMDDSMIKEEEKEKMKAEVEKVKEEKAELLTQLTNAELHVGQVKEELESAKRAIENADIELAEKVAEHEALKEESVTKVNKLEMQIAETAENSEAALEVLRSELSSKYAEIAGLKEKMKLRDAEGRAKDYELAKIKEDRDWLMNNNEAKLKQAQAVKASGSAAGDWDEGEEEEEEEGEKKDTEEDDPKMGEVAHCTPVRKSGRAPNPTEKMLEGKQQEDMMTVDAIAAELEKSDSEVKKGDKKGKSLKKGGPNQRENHEECVGLIFGENGEKMAKLGSNMYFYTGPGGAASESLIYSDNDDETMKVKEKQPEPLPKKSIEVTEISEKALIPLDLNKEELKKLVGQTVTKGDKEYIILVQGAETGLGGKYWGDVDNLPSRRRIKQPEHLKLGATAEKAETTAWDTPASRGRKRKSQPEKKPMKGAKYYVPLPTVQPTNPLTLGENI